MGVQLIVGHLADVGLERTHQEDAYGFQLSAADKILAQHRGAIFIVADGVGGQQAGELASRLAVETIRKSYYADLADDPAVALRNALNAANEVVHNAGRAAGRERMATTVVCAIVLQRRLHIGHVGDSRAYLLRDGRLTLLTEDHSWVNDQIRLGLLDREAAASHPRRNIITRALGYAPQVEPEISPAITLSDGDRVLLCTDGLYEGIEARQIEEILRSHPPQLACQKLVELANETGGTDNVTVIVIEILVRPEPRGSKETPAGESQFLPKTPTGAERTNETPAIVTSPIPDAATEDRQRDLEQREQELAGRQASLLEEEKRLHTEAANLATQQRELEKEKRRLAESFAAIPRFVQTLEAQRIAQTEAERQLHAEQERLAAQQARLADLEPVSYTHLTLPTIYSV